jgi:hypothetical protein
LHAGGVSRDNAGYLMAAYGGTGKTTFSIALLSNGFKLLGDDLLFVDTEKKIVHPYPRPMHIFTYNIHSLRGAKIPSKYTVKIYIKNALRYILERVLGIEFLISTRIHADEIFPGDVFSESVPYKQFLFLRKVGNATEVKSINSKNVASIASEVMASADLNDSLYRIVEEEFEINQIKKLESIKLQQLLKQFESITYVNTRKLDLTNLKGFIQKNLVISKSGK